VIEVLAIAAHNDFAELGFADNDAVCDFLRTNMSQIAPAEAPAIPISASSKIGMSCILAGCPARMMQFWDEARKYNYRWARDYAADAAEECGRGHNRACGGRSEYVCAAECSSTQRRVHNGRRFGLCRRGVLWQAGSSYTEYRSDRRDRRPLSTSICELGRLQRHANGADHWAL
jgi:hypothetical protein